MDKQLTELKQFNGSNEHYFNVFGFNITDGVKYVMDNGYSWLITDFLAVAKFNDAIKNEPFIAVRLKLNGTSGEMIVADGNNHQLYTQKYGYTDAKKELLLFFENQVLCLDSER